MTDVSTIGRPCGTCEHLDLFHNLNAKDERTRCDWTIGPQVTPCGCKRFTEATP